MLLSEDDLQERLESPLNLLNRLRNVTSPANIPSLPPSSKDLGLDKTIDEKLAVGKLRETAAGVMSSALAELKVRIGDVSKPRELAMIAKEMNAIVQSRENENRIPPQIIVYAPQVIQENHFQELTLTNE
jgi:hypothetical protein